MIHFTEELGLPPYTSSAPLRPSPTSSKGNTSTSKFSSRQFSHLWSSSWYLIVFLQYVIQASAYYSGGDSIRWVFDPGSCGWSQPRPQKIQRPSHQKDLHKYPLPSLVFLQTQNTIRGHLFMITWCLFAAMCTPRGSTEGKKQGKDTVRGERNGCTLMKNNIIYFTLILKWYPHIPSLWCVQAYLQYLSIIRFRASSLLKWDTAGALSNKTISRRFTSTLLLPHLH